MPLTETTERTYCIDPHGEVNVRADRVILDDDVEISRLPHRHVISPDDDDSDEPQEVRDVVAVARSTERVARYEARKAAER